MLLAEQLALKKYLTLQLEELVSEKRSIDFYLQNCIPHLSKTQELLLKPGYAELLHPIITPLSEELDAWAKEKYERSLNHPEHLSHKTAGDYYVRSKSEAMIDMILRLNKIPFRYECILHLGGSMFAPDFTLRHPKTGKIIYWEHFGKMDNTVYAQAAYDKLHYYSKYGIVPTINLITTFETSEKPLTTVMVEKVVKDWFEG